MARGFREDLDVGFIAAQYEVFAEPPPVEREEWSVTDIEADYIAATNEPMRFGNGPLHASSCVALACTYPPDVCHDVNGYYRALGVSHRATKSQLRKAYQKLDGQSSEYLTWILKTLLDPVVRREYDLLPMGSIYLEDPVVQDRIKKNAAMEARRRRQSGHSSTAEAVLAEWGFEHLDGPEISEKDPAESHDSEPQDVIFERWLYAYYLWKCAPATDTERLRRWQSLLIHVMAHRGIIMDFAVGLIGGEGYLVHELEDKSVFFIDPDIELTHELASDAIDFSRYT